MKIYAFINPKGGVGKTTFCMNLAALVVGSKSLIIDCDPQQSSQAWFDNRPGGYDFPQCKSVSASDLHTTIAKSANEGYQNIFIDSQGRDAPSSKIIAQLSDIVIMPVRPSALDLIAINDAISQSGKGNDTLKLVVSQGFVQGPRNEQAIELLSAIKIGKVSPHVINSRVIYQDAAGNGLSVTEMEPNGDAAKEIKQLWEWINE